MGIGRRERDVVVLVLEPEQAYGLRGDLQKLLEEEGEDLGDDRGRVVGTLQRLRRAIETREALRGETR